MVTLGEFLKDCEKATWMLEAKSDQGHVVTSGAASCPIVAPNVSLDGLTASSGLIGEVKDADRVVGTLLGQTILEDRAVFKLGESELTVWRTRKIAKED